MSNQPQTPLNIKNGLNVLAFLINVLFRIDLGPGYPRWLEAASEFGMFETILTPERYVIYDKNKDVITDIFFYIYNAPLINNAFQLQTMVCHF